MSLKNSGLNSRAKELVGAEVEVREKVERRYPCGRVSKLERTVSLPRFNKQPLKVEDVDGHQIELFSYVSPEGQRLEEYVQAVVRNCYVNVFIALRDGAGKPVEASVWEQWEVGVWSACYCKHTC